MASPLGKRVLDYFDLRAPARGPQGEMGAPGTATVRDWRRDLWPLVIYAAGVVGILAKQWYDAYQRGDPFDLRPSTFVLAVVVSAVTFPITYHSLQAEAKPGLQIFLALQNGFFWQVVLNHAVP
jgi:hypothetical protein